MLKPVRMTVLASGSKGNATIISAGATSLLVDAGLSCRELLRRMAETGEDPARLTAILITHEHLDHVAGLSVLARRLGIPVFFTEATHRAWVRMLTPRRTLTYAQWLANLQRERVERAGDPLPAETAATNSRGNHLPAHLLRPREAGSREAGNRQAGKPAAGAAVALAAQSGEDEGFSLPTLDAATDQESLDALMEAFSDPSPSSALEPEPCEPEEIRAVAKADPTFLPAVEYFRAGQRFSIGEIDINPFTIPHDAADPCGFVFHARTESLRMAVVTDLGYVPPNVKLALREVDVLLLESNHDLEMLKDGPYPWSVKQRVLSRVGHLSNAAAAEFLTRDYDGGAHTIVLGHLSEQNNLPDLARMAAEQAIGDRLSLLGNRIVLAGQDAPLQPIRL